MRRPDGITCRQCEHYWWYTGSCSVYRGVIRDENNNKCCRFIIKTKSEDSWYDPLPTPEQLKIIPLKTCSICGLKIYNERDLDKFTSHKKQLYGKMNRCKKCINEIWRKRRREKGFKTFYEKQRLEILSRYSPPYICYFCNKIITKLEKQDNDSLSIHSLDHNHDNWAPENKVLSHIACHTAFHNSTDKKYLPKTQEMKERISKKLSGRKLSPSHIENIRNSLIGDKCYKWKGDNAKPGSKRARKWKEKKRRLEKEAQGSKSISTPR